MHGEAAPSQSRILYIIGHWEELADGDVVDVSFILGETAEPKRSERFSVDL